MPSYGPSLARFVLDRVDDDMKLIMMNTPIYLGTEHHLGPELAELLTNRDRLLTRLGGVGEVVEETVRAMQAEQEGQLVHDPVALPVSALGEFILKTFAHRHYDHPDYNPDWDLWPAPDAT